MLGDGSIGIYESKINNKIKKHFELRVTLDSRNNEYISHVSDIMRDVLNTIPKIRPKNKENAVDIRVFKKEKIYFALNKIGLKISPKWNTMKIPDKYSKGPLGLLVLKVLFDTDGHLSVFKNNGIPYPRIEIRLCPSPAQIQISNILDEFNFNYKIQALEKGKTRIRISGKNQLEKWFELIGSSNPIHYSKYNNISIS